MAIRENHIMRGMVCALLAGVLWGFSGSCAQLLFRDYGVSALWLTSMRMSVAGIVLLVVSAIMHRKRFVEPLRSGRSFGLLLCFALFGVAFSQLTYLAAIENSNASTATVLQYTGPALVMLVVCVRQRRRPLAREFLALVFVIVGTFLLATHGDPSHLVLTPAGLTWGLLSAVGLALYTLIPVSLMQKFGPVEVLAWAFVIGGAVLCAIERPWAADYVLDVRGWLALLGGLSLLGTAVAFFCYFQGVEDVGPTRASMLASVEVVSATCFAVLWLGTSFVVMDLVGLVLILSATFLLAKRPKPKLSS